MNHVWNFFLRVSTDNIPLHSDALKGFGWQIFLRFQFAWNSLLWFKMFSNIEGRDLLLKVPVNKKRFNCRDLVFVMNFTKGNFCRPLFNSQTSVASRNAVLPLFFKVSSQSPEQRASLSRSYPTDALFVALQSVQPLSTDPLGLSLREGDLVAVIKQSDPMGNANRWFVNSGNAKGFVPASVLHPFKSPPPYGYVTAAEEGKSWRQKNYAIADFYMTCLTFIHAPAVLSQHGQAMIQSHSPAFRRLLILFCESSNLFMWNTLSDTKFSDEVLLKYTKGRPFSKTNV